MKKSTYLIILFLLSFGYFDYIVYSESSNDVLLFASWVWALFGVFKYGNYSNNKLNVWSNKKYAFGFLGIMLISSLYPYVVYNQAIIDTLIAQRGNYSIVFLLLFLTIHPLENDFKIALRFCSYLTIIVMLVSIFFPEYFLEAERIDYLLYRQARGSTDLVTANPGANLLFFYFLFQLSKLYNKPKSKQFIEVVFLMLMIVLLQNRSRLIMAVPIFMYVFFTIKTNKRLYYWVLGAILLSLFSGYIIKTAVTLWDESLEQLADEDYNRWQSISFFLIEAKQNIFTIIFGHGISASGSDYLEFLLKAQRERFAILSDIGLLGTFYIYGVSFLGLVYMFVYRALKKTNVLYLKFFALYVLVVPTIQNFGVLNTGSALVYSMFFYLIIYHIKYGKRIDYLKIKSISKGIPVKDYIQK